MSRIAQPRDDVYSAQHESSQVRPHTTAHRAILAPDTVIPGQFDLFDLLKVKSTAERFAEYHAANPRVYEVLVRLARERCARYGRSRIAIAQLVEVARWDVSMSTDGEDYKISNDFRAYYARLIMSQEPDLAGVFVTRPSAADTAGVA